jgi:hypothetical protein
VLLLLDFFTDSELSGGKTLPHMLQLFASAASFFPHFGQWRIPPEACAPFTLFPQRGQIELPLFSGSPQLLHTISLYLFHLHIIYDNFIHQYFKFQLFSHL